MLLHSRATVVTLTSAVRPSSVIRHPSNGKSVISETIKRINAKFWNQLPVQCPPYLKTLGVFLFVKMLNFSIFYDLFFVSFSLTWDHGRKKSNDISSEITHQIHYPKIMHTPREGLYQSCSKNCELSNFEFLPFFFMSSLTYGTRSGQSFKRHLLWKNTPDLLPKIHIYSWGESLSNLLKE